MNTLQLALLLMAVFSVEPSTSLRRVRFKLHRPRSALRHIIRCCGRTRCLNPKRLISNTTYHSKRYSAVTSISKFVGDSSTGAETPLMISTSAESSIDESMTTFDNNAETQDQTALYHSTPNEGIDSSSTGSVESQSPGSVESQSPGSAESQSSGSQFSNEQLTTLPPSTSVSITSSNASATATSFTSPSTTSSTSTTTTSTSTTPTPTTTTPRCQVPECTAFKKLDASANVNASSPGGRYLSACGRRYFISNRTETLSSAVSSCAIVNNSLLSIETSEEFQCLEKALFSVYNTSAKRANKTFWTSGSNEGFNCDVQNVHSWCTTGALMNQTLLMNHTRPAQFSEISEKRCLALSLPSDNGSTVALLTHAACSGNLTYICEPTCLAPTCPDGSCSKNASLFDANDKLIRPETYGKWIDDCPGSIFLFGNKPVTFEQNRAICCSLGMAPLTLDSGEEQECLSNRTNINWTGNYNYWTAGTQKGCRGSWSWCSGSKARPITDGSIVWDVGQPDNKGGNQDCIHLKLGNLTGLRITDRNCTDRYIFACKGEIKKNVAPLSATCPGTPCKKNLTLFASDGLSVKNYDTYGTWLSGCGKLFLFSRKNATWAEAREQCCMLGMTLADMPSLGKHQCFENKVSDFINIRPINDSFWLYGTDKDVPGRFHWCSNRREFWSKETVWGQGEPASTDSCVYIQSRGVNESKLATSDCNQTRRFICDIRSKNTSGYSQQRECMETWGISYGDIDATLTNISVSSANYTREMKCFLKCMGEFSGLFFMGAVVSSEVLRKIEISTKDDPVKMQSGFDSFDECTSKVYEDECVTTAETFSCGLQKEPVIMLDMIDESRGNNTVYSPPVPCINPRHCHLEGRRACNVNPTLRNEFLTTGKTSLGKGATFPNKGTVFVVQKSKLTLVEAYDYCCSLGMRLIELKPTESLLSLYPGISGFAIVGETYQVDDNTDAWCRSKQVIPAGQYPKGHPTFDCDQSKNYLTYDVCSCSPGMDKLGYTIGFVCENP